MPGFPLRFHFLLLALMFSIVINAQRKTDVLQYKYAPQNIKEDLIVFKKVIMAMHPAVGLYYPPAHYTKMFDTAIEQVHDSISEKTFRILCKGLVEELHCGHTEVLGSKAYNKAIGKAKLNYSPYVFLPIQDKLYVIANLNKKQDSIIPKGVEVLSINSISSDSLIRHCKRFISTDGFNQTSKYHFVQLGFNNLYPALFGRPDSLTLEYKDGRITKQHQYSAFKAKNIPPIPLKKTEDSLFKFRKKAGIRYRKLNGTQQLFILKLDKFSHRAYQRQYKKIFRQLEKDHIRNLVLDLRNNGGGSLANAYKLLSYLIDSNYTQTLLTRIKKYPEKKYTKGNLSFKFTRYVFSLIGKHSTKHDTDIYTYTLKLAKKYHYSGNLFVFINGGSFSASCLTAAYLRGRQNTLFIGEESGGTIEGCNAGITPYYTLPNTKIRIRVPAFRLNFDVHPDLSGRGIFPDYPIQYSFKDIVTRKDLELQKVLSLIN